MATLGLMGAVSYYSMSGDSKAAKQQGPPIKASSSDEESFIKEFLKSAEKEEKGQKH
ncbi:MAG: hypothetical protein M1813_002415 [Trichoglossum hirsutum]|nr:MAG: hypothetical protein M1813_002415 [Trichoglossum hirsutum]